MTFRAFAAALLLAAAAPAKAQFFTPEGQKYFDQAQTSLYNLDYEESRSQLRRLIALEPENPYSYLAEAGMIWWQSGNEYGLFKDTPTLEDLFENDIKSAMQKGEAALDAAEHAHDEKAQARSHFVIGMAVGTRGEWKVIRRHWLGAYFDGKHGVKHLKHCLQHDPEFYDAYIGLGLYDYMTDHLPKALKISTLFFIHGNAKRGLERMQMAYERGQYTSSYAAEYLASIYILDQHDNAKALPLIQGLRARFPQSPYFQFLEIGTLARLGDPSALGKAKALAAQVQSDPAFLGRKQLSLWCGLFGEDCFTPRGVESAAAWLNDAISKTQTRRAKPSFWLDLLHFYRGVANDFLDRHDSAVEDYAYVMKGPNFGAVNALARHCLETACNKSEVLRQLKSMSLESVGAPDSVPSPKREEPDGSEENSREKSP